MRSVAQVSWGHVGTGEGPPLDVPNSYLDKMLSAYGSLFIGTEHLTWRNTAIRTGREH